MNTENNVTLWPCWIRWIKFSALKKNTPQEKKLTLTEGLEFCQRAREIYAALHNLIVDVVVDFAWNSAANDSFCQRLLTRLHAVKPTGKTAQRSPVPIPVAYIDHRVSDLFTACRDKDNSCYGLCVPSTRNVCYVWGIGAAFIQNVNVQCKGARQLWSAKTPIVLDISIRWCEKQSHSYAEMTVVRQKKKSNKDLTNQIQL